MSVAKRIFCTPFFWAFLLSFFSQEGLAKPNTLTQQWVIQEQSAPHLKVELFQSTTCSHCEKAHQFLDKLQNVLPWIQVVVYDINHDPKALKLFSKRLKAVENFNFAVPSVFFCGSHWLGFSEDLSKNTEFIRGLYYCHDQVSRQHQLNDETIQLLSQWSWAHTLLMYIPFTEHPNRFILLTALFDSVNPCTYFAYGFCLLLMLMGGCARWKGWALIFGIFLTNHYFIQVHSERYFMVYPYLIYFSRAVGVFALYELLKWCYAMIHAKNLMIQWSRISHFGVLFLFSTLLMQQSCQGNIALVYQQWLNQFLSSIHTYWLYLLMYQGLYLLFISLGLGVVYWMITYKITPKRQLFLRVFSILMFFAMAGLMIVFPHAFSSMFYFMGILLGCFMITFTLVRYRPFLERFRESI